MKNKESKNNAKEEKNLLVSEIYAKLDNIVENIGELEILHLNELDALRLMSDEWKDDKIEILGLSNLEEYMQKYKISFNKRTFSFYIQQGLIEKPERGSGNKAIYTQNHITIYILVEYFKSSFSLDKIKQILMFLRPRIESEGVVSLIKFAFTVKLGTIVFFEALKDSECLGNLVELTLDKGIEEVHRSSENEEEIIEGTNRINDMRKKFIGNAYYMQTIISLILIVFGKELIDNNDNVIAKYNEQISTMINESLF